MLQELIIYQKCYDFVLYIFPVVDRFPRHEKFALCTQIKNCVLDISRLIISANKSRSKTALLYDVDVRLEELRFLLRFSHDRRYLSKKSYEPSGKLLSEIGRLLGG